MSDPLNAAEAVYGVLAWLTTRDRAVTLSSRHDAGTAATLAKEFIETNKLGDVSSSWPGNLVHPPAAPTDAWKVDPFELLDKAGIDGRSELTAVARDAYNAKVNDTMNSDAMKKLFPVDKTPASPKWDVYRCHRADPDQACGIREVEEVGDPRPLRMVVSDTDHYECCHHMRLADAQHIVDLHNAAGFDLRVRGDLPPEQFEEFKRRWTQEVAKNSRGVIVDSTSPLMAEKHEPVAVYDHVKLNSIATQLETAENLVAKLTRMRDAHTAIELNYIEHVDALAKEIERKDEALDLAWVIIANAGGGGDWTKETKDWKTAAEKWRDGHYLTPWKGESSPFPSDASTLTLERLERAASTTTSGLSGAVGLDAIEEVRRYTALGWNPFDGRPIYSRGDLPPEPSPEAHAKSTIVDQPPPTQRPNLVPVWEKVIEDFSARWRVDQIDHLDNVAQDVLDDMRSRDRIGRERYGTPLTTNNGRDQLVDAYQELLDAAVYLKAAILEGKRVSVAVYNNLLDDVVHVRQLINDRKA